MTTLAASHRGTMILVALAAATVVAVGMGMISSILVPVLLTLVLTICAHPVRVALERWGFPHGLATGSVVLVVFLFLAGFVVALVIAFTQFVGMLPQYAGQLADLGSKIGEWLGKLGIGQDQIQALLKGIDPNSIVDFATGLFGGLFNVTTSLIVVLTMLILMAADAMYVPTILRQLLGTHQELVVSLAAYASNVRRYMVVTTMLGIVQGALNTVALVIMGVPAAVLWGLLAFLCSFIPNVGYFLAIIPPIVFGFFVGGWPTVIGVIITYAVINGVVQSIIQPKVVGNAVALSQSLTFLSVLFWAVVFGPMGAILAIPLTLLARAILVDSDPDARKWRPAIGDIAEARRLIMQDDAAAKAVRRARRRAREAGASLEAQPSEDRASTG
ncbi:AI-2E family transporter [Paeniglutamicibacter sp. NPDC012692]|uniref:AI-2E family transporter n=1 Tax=Paeniglutamicibacter sp. NPDC012692 TaxID=3364388 RepID=UPI00368177B8